jgi:hypothetical protein
MRTATILLSLLVSACSVQQAREPAAHADSGSNVAYKKLDLTYTKPAVVGAEVRVAATDLPAGKTIELRWGTVTGGWVIEDYYHFRRNTRRLRHRSVVSTSMPPAISMRASRFQKISAEFTK